MLALAATVFPFNTHLAFYSTFWGGLTLLLAALYAGSLLARDAEAGAGANGRARVPLSGGGHHLQQRGNPRSVPSQLGVLRRTGGAGSGSTDATREIAQRHGAHRRAPVRRLRTAEAGRDRPGQPRLDPAARRRRTPHPAGRAAIEADLRHRAPTGIACRAANGCSGSGPARTRPNWQLRLFRKSRGRMNAVPVHAAPVWTTGRHGPGCAVPPTANRRWPIAWTR